MKMRLHVGSMSVPQARRLMCDLVIGIKDYAVPHDENEEEKNSLVDARINALGFANVGKPFAKIPDSEVGVYTLGTTQRGRNQFGIVCAAPADSVPHVADVSFIDGIMLAAQAIGATSILVYYSAVPNYHLECKIPVLLSKLADCYYPGLTEMYFVSNAWGFTQFAFVKDLLDKRPSLRRCVEDTSLTCESYSSSNDSLQFFYQVDDHGTAEIEYVGKLDCCGWCDYVDIPECFGDYRVTSIREDAFDVGMDQGNSKDWVKHVSSLKIPRYLSNMNLRRIYERMPNLEKVEINKRNKFYVIDHEGMLKALVDSPAKE